MQIMQKCVKKQDVLKTMEFDGDEGSCEDLQEWLGSELFQYNCEQPSIAFFKSHKMKKGDWIVLDDTKDFIKVSKEEFKKDFIEIF